MILLLQIIVIICFLIVIVALFREKTDFLTYSMVAMIIAVLATFILYPKGLHVEMFILAIEWEVIFFLIALFTIVEILEDKRIFEEIALRITKKFHTNTRKFFWTICIISTLCAALIEDISVIIIFVPLVISTCKKMRVNPAPFLLGMTICINLAATLTPFGSSQNILITNKFNLTGSWFIINLGLYFIIAALLSLFLLDYFILRKHLQEIWTPHCEEYQEPMDLKHCEDHELFILEDPIDKRIFNRNIIALIIFIFLLFLIPSILLVGIIGAIMFVLINPRRDNETGKKRYDISYYLSKVDYRLVFFFITLFIIVFCMEINGTIKIIEKIVINTTPDNLFIICIVILLATSILSGFLDNVPVTIIFIPVITAFIAVSGYAATPLLIAFILGINLGGNFLPQGAASDMMTLELAKKHHIHEMNYKKLLKVGGMFAILHILIGIGYLWFYIYILL